MSLANQDSAEVKSIYGVLVNESKTAKEPTDKPATYGKLISRGLILEAGIKGFISVLNDAVTKIDKLNDGGANSLNFQPSKTRADVVNDINKILKDMNSTAEQTVKLVSGLNAQYEEIKDKTKDPTLVSKDKIAEHNAAYEKDYTKKPDDNSFIAKNKDKADAEVSDNLVSAGGGRYTRTTGGANNFSEDLNGNKFEVVSAEASVPVTQQPVANNATETPQQVVVDNSGKTDKQVATPSPTDNSKELGELKDELKKLKDLQTKEKPKASDDSSKSSSPNASNPSLAGLRASYDADRAKREKEMAEQRRLQEAAKIIADAKRKSRLPKT
ncbi:MAG TPA: hypothetical protein PK443_01770, partial [bacterium]|nr:hypothetical protein [bacterium]